MQATAAKMGDKPLPSKPAIPAQPATTGGQRGLRLDDDETMSDEDEYKDAIDVTMATEPHPLPAVPSQELVSSMGVNTHRVQVMKASFFGAVEERAQPKPFLFGTSQQPLFQMAATPKSLLDEQTASSLSRQLSTSGLKRHTPLHLLSSSRLRWSGSSRTTPTSSQTPGGPMDRPSHPHHLAASSMQAQAAVIMAKHNLSLLVPPSKSLVSDKTSNVADAGLVMGRSFRVGWGPNWTLAHSGVQISHSAATNTKSFGLFSAGFNYPSDGEGLPLRVVVEQVHTGTAERKGSSRNTPKQVCDYATHNN